MVLTKLALLEKMRTIKFSVSDEVKAKNVLPFGQQSHINVRKPATFNLQNTAKKLYPLKCAQGQNTTRNRNEIDFKSKEENCVFMNGL